VFTANNFGVQE